jgi:hypothetical protein
MSGKGKRGQAYNLNLAGSGILAPDGRCSWHRCRACSTSPNSNRAFWDRKRETNMARDRRALWIATWAERSHGGTEPRGGDLILNVECEMMSGGARGAVAGEEVGVRGLYVG